MERRYTFPVGKLMGVVREKLKWADGKLVKEIIEKQVRAQDMYFCPLTLLYMCISPCRLKQCWVPRLKMT